MPEVMSSRLWMVSAFFLSSTLAIVRSEKKSSTRWSGLANTPSLKAIAIRVPTTALVTEFTLCLRPILKGA
jgi:hypothetical protein